MLVGSLCYNICLITTEKKFKKEKVYLVCIPWKLPFMLNLYALSDADPGDSDAGVLVRAPS